MLSNNIALKIPRLPVPVVAVRPPLPSKVPRRGGAGRAGVGFLCSRGGAPVGKRWRSTHTAFTSQKIFDPLPKKLALYDYSGVKCYR